MLLLIFVCLQRGFCDSEMENYKHDGLWIKGSFSMSENNLFVSDALRPERGQRVSVGKFPSRRSKKNPAILCYGGRFKRQL